MKVLCGAAGREGFVENICKPKQYMISYTVAFASLLQFLYRILAYSLVENYGLKYGMHSNGLGVGVTYVLNLL